MTTKVQIVINQGSSYKFMGKVQQRLPDGCVGNACSVMDMDLTGKQVRSHLKSTIDSCSFYEFVPVITDAEAGMFELHMGAVYTATIPAGNYVFDVEVFDPNDPDDVLRPFEGTATVSPEVTK